MDIWAYEVLYIYNMHEGLMKVITNNRKQTCLQAFSDRAFCSHFNEEITLFCSAGERCKWIRQRAARLHRHLASADVESAAAVGPMQT